MVDDAERVAAGAREEKGPASARSQETVVGPGVRRRTRRAVQLHAQREPRHSLAAARAAQGGELESRLARAMMRVLRVK